MSQAPGGTAHILAALELSFDDGDDWPREEFGAREGKRSLLLEDVCLFFMELERAPFLPGTGYL